MTSKSNSPAKRFWLMKSEPEVLSIAQLKKQGRSLWDGVRNYQARNFMMNDMKPGDEILFYHSNAEPSGIAGLAKVAAPAVPDPTQFDRKSEYFDPKATVEKPRWFCVEVEFLAEFPHFIPLSQLRNDPNCAELLVLRPGQRLSIQPVDAKDFQYLKRLGTT